MDIRSLECIVHRDAHILDDIRIAPNDIDERISDHDLCMSIRIHSHTRHTPHLLHISAQHYLNKHKYIDFDYDIYLPYVRH